MAVAGRELLPRLAQPLLGVVAAAALVIPKQFSVFLILEALSRSLLVLAVLAALLCPPQAATAITGPQGAIHPLALYCLAGLAVAALEVNLAPRQEAAAVVLCRSNRLRVLVVALQGLLVVPQDF